MSRPCLDPEPFARSSSPRLPRRAARWLMLDLRPARFREAHRRPRAFGVILRLTLLPTLLLGVAAALVSIGTHPPHTPATLDPASAGVYYEPVAFLTADGQRLEGWLVPAVDERLVLARRELILTDRHPGVVLAHDFAGSREQMLRFVRPLHEGGFSVLAIDLRGCGESDPAGQTFGLREAADVRAGLDLLRKRRLVDPLRLAAVGLGTGGSAALAVAGDLGVMAVVAVAPPASADAAVAEHLLPEWARAEWTVALVRRVFELLYATDSRELDRPHDGPTVLVMSRDRREVERAVDFVRAAASRRVVAMRD